VAKLRRRRFERQMPSLLSVRREKLENHRIVKLSELFKHVLRPDTRVHLERRGHTLTKGEHVVQGFKPFGIEFRLMRLVEVRHRRHLESERILRTGGIEPSQCKMDSDQTG